jgi:hypothetical protein
MILLKISDQVYSGFSVPIFQSKMEDMEPLNERVAAYLILQRVLGDSGDSFDWKTDPDLHKKGMPEIDSIVTMFGNAISHLTRLKAGVEVPAEDMHISADVWGSINKSGAVRSMMNFAPLHWRGIYFVKCATRVTVEISSPYPQSPIPGTGRYSKPQTKIVLEPKTSTAIVFPGNLTHTIIFAPGEGENIAVEVASGVLLTEKEKST